MNCFACIMVCVGVSAEQFFIGFNQSINLYVGVVPILKVICPMCNIARPHLKGLGNPTTKSPACNCKDGCCTSLTRVPESIRKCLGWVYTKDRFVPTMKYSSKVLLSFWH